MNAKRPAIAVIIVNFNSGDLLRRCLACLERQVEKPKRTIVIDNASTDVSCQDLDFAGVEILHLTDNLGFSAANNLGVYRADDCDWIALLNPDAFPEPDWLARLGNAVQTHAQYSFFGSRMVMANRTDTLDGAGDIYHVSGLAWRRGHGKQVSTEYLAFREVFAPCAAAALYRRDAFLAVGGFDETYFCYFEDVDLAFRLRLSGYRCLYVPDAMVAHVGSFITGRASPFTIYHGHRNLVWTFFKNMPAPLLLLYLPQHVLLNLVTLIAFSFRGLGKTIFKAKLDSLRGLPRILRERAVIQSRRKVGSRELRGLMARGLLSLFADRGR